MTATWTPQRGSAPEHGEPRLYKRGCRCDLCTKANTVHHKRWQLGQTNYFVDPTGTHRRIQALAVLGWTYTEIAEACGVTTKGWVVELLGHDRILSDTAKRVSAAFERMCMTIPEGKRRDHCRTMARRKGWVAPLAWTNIDDPNEHPRGWQYKPATRAETFMELVERGVGVSELCRHLGLTRAALQKWCANNGLSAEFRAACGREHNYSSSAHGGAA